MAEYDLAIHCQGFLSYVAGLHGTRVNSDKIAMVVSKMETTMAMR